MFAPLNKLLLFFLSGVGFVIPVMANDTPPPPLQHILETLHCTKEANMAQTILKKLSKITTPTQPWPDEWLGQKPEPTLHAGLLDIALDTLKTTAERFPDLREEAERIALQWNYCNVIEDHQFYDLILRQQKLHKRLAANDAPLRWQGFREWGFITPDPTPRFVPKLLDEIRIAPTAYHLFLHEIYRKRCFPHPETGLLASEADSPSDAVSNHALPLTVIAEETPQPYPFKWNNVCPSEQLPATATQPSNKPPLTTATTQKTKPPTPQKVSEAPVVTKKAERKQQREVRQQARQQQKQERIATQITQLVTPVEPPAQPEPVIETLPATDKDGARGDVGQLTAPAPLALVNEPVNKKPVSEPVNQATELPAIMPIAAGGDIPMYIEEDDEEDELSNEQSHSTTGIIDPKGKQKKTAKKKKLRLAGSFSDTISLKDGSNSLSASVTWSPKPNWFVSGSASLKEGQPGYSWSAGYNDYKPGGVSAQINNWGPIKPGEGLALDKAVVNIGKKLESETLKKHKLATSTNLSIPIKGKPSLSGTMQWNPKPNVYARTTASVPLEGGKPNWNYVVGYSSPKPGGLKIEYSNYGKNNFPGDNLKDGAITVSRGWQF